MSVSYLQGSNFLDIFLLIEYIFVIFFFTFEATTARSLLR